LSWRPRQVKIPILRSLGDKNFVKPSLIAGAYKAMPQEKAFQGAA